MSSIDRREEILSRLMTIFEEMPGILRVYRNVEDVSAKERPAILMHDASEETSDIGSRPNGAMKDFFKLSPQIYIILGNRATVVGSQISEFRNSLVKRVWSDTILRDLVGIGRNRESDIRYHGCGLDTTTGETREARLQAMFEFTYLLDLNELP